MKREHGHAFIEIYLIVSALGIALALVVPHFAKMRTQLRLHQCAVVIDAGEPGAVCPLTHVPIDVDAITHERCCPTPQSHHLESLDALCTKAGAPPLASVYPGPSNAKRIFWNVTMAIVGGISAIVFTLIFGSLLIAFVSDPRGFWAAVNRRGF